MSIDRTSNPSSNYTICTSGTRPSSPSSGMAIYETDTNLAYVYDGAGWKPLGQATKSWTVIEHTELGSDGTIDFQNIPQTFTHLKVDVFARDSTAGSTGSVYMRLNNDSGANYDVDSVYGINGSAGSERQTAASSAKLFLISGSSASAVGFGSGSILLNGYRSVTGSLARRGFTSYGGYYDAGGGYNGFVWVTANVWRSSSAISRITLAGTSWGNLKTGSMATLLGLRT